MFIVDAFDILLEIQKWMIDEIQYGLAKGETGDSREKEKGKKCSQK
jgi:predicted transcriptional regulator